MFQSSKCGNRLIQCEFLLKGSLSALTEKHPKNYCRMLKKLGCCLLFFAFASLWNNLMCLFIYAICSGMFGFDFCISTDRSKNKIVLKSFASVYTKKLILHKKARCWISINNKSLFVNSSRFCMLKFTTGAGAKEKRISEKRRLMNATIWCLNSKLYCIVEMVLAGGVTLSNDFTDARSRQLFCQKVQWTVCLNRRQMILLSSARFGHFEAIF